MEEIEIGSEWSCDEYVTLKKVIVRALFDAGDGERRVAYENVWTDGQLTFGAIARKAFLAMHEPMPSFFEENAWYRLKDCPMSKVKYQALEIRSLNGKPYAILIRYNGDDVSPIIAMDNFAYYERV